MEGACLLRTLGTGAAAAAAANLTGRQLLAAASMPLVALICASRLNTYQDHSDMCKRSFDTQDMNDTAAPSFLMTLISSNRDDLSDSPTLIAPLHATILKRLVDSCAPPTPPRVGSCQLPTSQISNPQAMHMHARKQQ